ncbi:hypothetical protein RRG08_066502 [Elysia crispata]|uniref:Uncharacterized protein n=1 Tax=Elysia crispata TaxID=231223 RepID=A0AAE0YIC7_9GAST|nr:hypothetical protein RRG08_066502 [Elysia crispata]
MFRYLLLSQGRSQINTSEFGAQGPRMSGHHDPDTGRFLAPARERSQQTSPLGSQVPSPTGSENHSPRGGNCPDPAGVACFKTSRMFRLLVIGTLVVIPPRDRGSSPSRAVRAKAHCQIWKFTPGTASRHRKETEKHDFTLTSSTPNGPASRRTRTYSSQSNAPLTGLSGYHDVVLVLAVYALCADSVGGRYCSLVPH